MLFFTVEEFSADQGENHHEEGDNNGNPVGDCGGESVLAGDGLGNGGCKRKRSGVVEMNIKNIKVGLQSFEEVNLLNNVELYITIVDIIDIVSWVNSKGDNCHCNYECNSQEEVGVVLATPYLPPSYGTEAPILIDAVFGILDTVLHVIFVEIV